MNLPRWMGRWFSDTGPPPAGNPAGLYRRSVFAANSGNHLTHDVTGIRLRASPRVRRAMAAAAAPAELSTLLRGVSAREGRTLMEGGFLVPVTQDEGRSFVIRQVDIETTRHCNARCVFCPQSVDPKPVEIMTMLLFERIVGQIAPERPVWVALNHYNEPLLDPHFIDRYRVIADHGLKLKLFTNGTVLSRSISEALLARDSLSGVVFNVAAGDAATWSAMMGLPESLFERTAENIIRFVRRFRRPAEILVNGVTDDQPARVDGVRRRFAGLPNLTVQAWESHDRAGAIKHQSVIPSPVQSQARLAGCPRIAEHVHIGITGNVYLCCQDYEQRVILGNVTTDHVRDIFGGPAAAALRRQIYGLEDAPPDMICRGCFRLRAAT